MEITSIGPFLQYYRRVRERTLQIVERIPPDRIEWTYRKGKFTLGDLVRHLGAIERYMFVEVAMGRPSVYPGHGRDLAEGKDAAVEYLNATHAESLEILGAMTEADLQRKCMTPAGFEMAVWKWLRSMVEHEIHHRRQIYIYLGILEEEVPALYGLTEEQVYERSQGGGD